MKLVCFLFFFFFICSQNSFAKLNFSDEQAAFTYFTNNPNHLITQDDVTDAIGKCWLDVSEQLITKSIDQNNDFSFEIKRTINTLKQKLDRLTALLNINKKIDIVKASFQWAQSPEYIFLNIKFSHRWSSPGALKVKDEQVLTEKNRFQFSALSNDPTSSTKKYVVDLTLLHNIIESETKYSFASVGKVVVTLKKEKKKIWNRLLLSKEKNPSMHVWWDMKEKHDPDIKKFLKEKEKRKRDKKARKLENALKGEKRVVNEEGKEDSSTVPGTNENSNKDNNKENVEITKQEEEDDYEDDEEEEEDDGALEEMGYDNLEETEDEMKSESENTNENKKNENAETVEQTNADTSKSEDSTEEL